MAYETDLSAWASEQAALLRAGRFSELDVEHLAEEIEDLSRRDLRALRSAMRDVLEHLVKLQYSPGPRADWKETVAKQRAAIGDCLVDSPGLQPKLGELLALSWADTRRVAVIAGFAAPDANPFTLENVLDVEFFPDS